MSRIEQISYILFNISLHFGQSQLVKAAGYESFYLDVLVSTFTASCVSFLICILVKKVKEERIEEMRAYYSLGLQSSVFVHDAKASLIHTYRQLEDNNNPKSLIEDSMTKLKSMLENAKATEHSSLINTFNQVLADIQPYVEKAHFHVLGEDINLKIPEYYLKSVLFNLVSNALRAVSEQGRNEPTIEMIINKNGFHLLDNGPGFSEELITGLAKGNVYSTSNFGNGLGIINSKKLIESFDGEFSIENTTKGGKVSIAFFK